MEFGPQSDIELLNTWTADYWDNRPDWERDIRALLYFHEVLLFREVNSEYQLDGCSFSQRGQHILLVVKAMKGDTPVVAFVTERTTTGCIVIFGRQFLQDRVKWHKDKFR